MLSGLNSKLKATKAGLTKTYAFFLNVFEGKSATPTPEKLLRRRRRLAHILFDAVLAFVVAFIVSMPGPLTPHVTELRPGDIAEQDMVSPLTVDVEPKRLSESRRDELSKKIAPVFDYDDSLLEEWLQKWQSAFQKVRSEQYTNRKVMRPTPVLIENARRRLVEITGQSLPAEDIAYLSHKAFSATNEHLFVAIGEHLLGRLIAPTDLFPYYYSTGIIVRQLNHALSETFIYDLSRVWSLEQAGEYLSHIPSILRDADPEMAGRMAEIVTHVMVPNLKLNAELTEKRMNAALAAVNRSVWSVRRGQIVVKRGERVTDAQSEMLHSLKLLMTRRSIFDRLFLRALALFVLLEVLLGSNITRKGFRYLRFKDALFFFTLFVFTLVAIRYGLPYLRLALASLHFHAGAEYLLPVAFGGIIVHLMMGKETAHCYALALSAALGFLLDNSFEFSLFVLATNLSAIQTVKSCKQRTDLYRAGAMSGLVGASLVGCFVVLGSQGLFRTSWLSAVACVCLAFLSGLVSSAIASTIIPMLESLLGYTTSLKLLELSNFNHPLLHNLMMKAPGTYHHSIIVGSLAEIAADRVKANGLLARVSAYYHDIGKMNKPLYFIENQSPNNNPHDHLQPNMSAKILFSHVKLGVKMAKDHNLGAKITNIIEQHHGTTLVSFFLNKAKKGENAGVDQVNEEDFRYPGPRPQTREAGIVMLADACEAATRSIAEPTPAKIQSMVHNIITRRFLEDQLSECDLTFNDLKTIEEYFTRTLVSLHHHRIEYPGQASNTAPPPPGAVAIPLPVKH